MKKICSQLDSSIGKITAVGKQQLDNLQIYQIILIDPSIIDVINTKEMLLNIGLEQFNNRNEYYNQSMNKINKRLQNLNKLRIRTLKKLEKKQI